MVPGLLPGAFLNTLGSSGARSGLVATSQKNIGGEGDGVGQVSLKSTLIYKRASVALPLPGPHMWASSSAELKFPHSRVRTDEVMVSLGEVRLTIAEQR